MKQYNRFMYNCFQKGGKVDVDIVTYLVPPELWLQIKDLENLVFNNVHRLLFKRDVILYI